MVAPGWTNRPADRETGGRRTLARRQLGCGSAEKDRLCSLVTSAGWTGDRHGEVN